MVDRASRRQHSVQFYETDAFLCEAVGRFLHEGLAKGAPVLVIATAAHCAAFTEYLRANGWNCEAARHDGLLTLIDAHATLEMFMVGGMPDERLFRSYMGSVLSQLAVVSRHPVQAYGEMVNVLWESGQRNAALNLEELWNDLGRRHAFNLLCAYALPNFVNGDEQALLDVCRHHTDVNGASDASTLELHLLQQRISALEVELASLKQSGSPQQSA
jgi:hypothetical protein